MELGMVATPELSRPVRLDQIGAEPHPVEVEPTAAERSALAERFGLIELTQLSARVDLTREGDRIVCVGRLRADVVQACVASGDPVPDRIDEDFELRFVPADEMAADDEVELNSGDLDTVEYDGGVVDVGEAVAQTLALALNPFPRAPGADQALREAGVIDEGEAGPFAALKALKNRL
jgi:uncharacterized metal-binding protein YceD (DUF177 family)